jgi:hypothetical protein
MEWLGRPGHDKAVTGRAWKGSERPGSRHGKAVLGVVRLGQERRSKAWTMAG